MSALERIARDASAHPLAAGCYAVTWRDARGNWHTAFCEDAADVPQAVAVARDGELVTGDDGIETTVTRMERVK